MCASLLRPMMVWTVSEDAPGGKWVDVRTIPGELPHDDGSHEAGAWAESSFDLLLGADVSDSPDTVPEDLLDQLFPPRDEPPKTSKK